ncbi:hypothetical protein [Mesorhizobium waimense]|uniref:hypothetical protein n=1 Tax=Mesorhizobium waimense TaxID=1300307 RepID=UPI003CCA8AE3
MAAWQAARQMLGAEGIHVIDNRGYDHRQLAFSAGWFPDHKTIADFRKDNSRALVDYNVQVRG